MTTLSTELPGKKPREQTRQLTIGGGARGGESKSVLLGGGAPVVVQTMLNTPTGEVAACLAQINALAEEGCSIIRLAVESPRDLDPFEEICKESPLPVVADVHFDYRLAVEAARRGAAKLRINPGNIGGRDKVDAVIEAAGEAGIAIRIGVNAGSLSEEIKSYEALSTAGKLVFSATQLVEHFEGRSFKDIVLSAKASYVNETIEAYRTLSMALPHIPLHLGITEAGTVWAGSIRSAVGIGTLLAEGIGDTVRVSLTADPAEELRVAHEILAALRLSEPRGVTLISCPTCSRCKVDLISIATEVEQRLSGVKEPLRVAVMGCVVNGPGEAAEADIGVACGKGTGAIFAKGKVLYTVEEGAIIESLFKELESVLK